MSAAVRLRVALICATGFLLLTVFVWLHPVIAGDHAVGARLLAEPGSTGWRIAEVVSFVASGPVVALCAAAAALWTLLRLRRPAGAIAIMAAPAVAGVIEVATKALIGRSRPVTAALSGESGNGYPSGHVSGFTALVVVLLVVWVLDAADTTSAERRSATVLAGSTIVLVAWSRVALGAHYLSDTVGAALLGITVGVLCPWLCDLAWERWRGRSRIEPEASGFTSG